MVRVASHYIWRTYLCGASWLLAEYESGRFQKMSSWPLEVFITGHVTQKGVAKKLRSNVQAVRKGG